MHVSQNVGKKKRCGWSERPTFIEDGVLIDLISRTPLPLIPVQRFLRYYDGGRFPASHVIVG